MGQHWCILLLLFCCCFVVVALDCDCLRRPLWLRAPGGRRYNHIWLFLMGMCYYDGYYSFRKDNRLRFVDQISISHYHYRLMGLTHKRANFKIGESSSYPSRRSKSCFVVGSLWPARYVRIVYTRTYTVLQTRARPATTPLRTTCCEFEGCRISMGNYYKEG